MELNVSGNNLNASEIFAKLDAMDGGGADGKIEASIWNQFANIAGGKQINNFIEKENAVNSISAYLSRATDKVKNKIAEFVNSGNIANLSADDAYAILKNTYEPWLAEQKAELVNGRVVAEDEATKQKNADKFRKMIELMRIVVNEPASNGVKYSVAKDIINGFAKQYINYAGTYKPIPGNKFGAQEINIDGLREILKAHSPGDLIAFEKAVDAIKELEEKYPEIGRYASKVSLDDSFKKLKEKQ